MTLSAGLFVRHMVEDKSDKSIEKNLDMYCKYSAE